MDIEIVLRDGSIIKYENVEVESGNHFVLVHDKENNCGQMLPILDIKSITYKANES